MNWKMHKSTILLMAGFFAACQGGNGNGLPAGPCVSGRCPDKLYTDLKLNKEYHRIDCEAADNTCRVYVISTSKSVCITNSTIGKTDSCPKGATCDGKKWVCNSN